MPLIDWLLRWWCVNDKLPSRIDLVALVSCATTKTGLTNGSRLTMKKADGILATMGNPKVAFGTFPGQETNWLEEKLKRTGLRGEKIYVGTVTSTTDECEAILKTSRPGDNIVFVTEGLHSRRARLVWKRLTPRDRNVFIVSVDPRKAADPKNPMFFQRGWVRWLLMNMALLPLYKFLPGVRFFAWLNLHQPTT